MDAGKAWDIVAAKMTSGQIAKARRLSQEWNPKKSNR